MSKVFGAYSYNQMKPQEYRSLFRDARRDFNKDFDAGLLPNPLVDPEEPEEIKPEAPVFKPSDFESWISSAGTPIEARLIAIDDNGKYVFETRQQKKVTVGHDQLSEESQTRAIEVTTPPKPKPTQVGNNGKKKKKG